MDRPEGALTPKELEALLDKHGKIRVYRSPPFGSWEFFVKEPAVGPAYSPQYSCINKDGVASNLDFNGFCNEMKTWPRHFVFTNYWHYYAYMLKRPDKGKE